MFVSIISKVSTRSRCSWHTKTCSCWMTPRCIRCSNGANNLVLWHRCTPRMDPSLQRYVLVYHDGLGLDSIWCMTGPKPNLCHDIMLTLAILLHIPIDNVEFQSSLCDIGLSKKKWNLYMVMHLHFLRHAQRYGDFKLITVYQFISLLFISLS